MGTRQSLATDPVDDGLATRITQTVEERVGEAGGLLPLMELGRADLAEIAAVRARLSALTEARAKMEPLLSKVA